MQRQEKLYQFLPRELKNSKSFDFENTFKVKYFIDLFKFWINKGNYICIDLRVSGYQVVI